MPTLTFPVEATVVKVEYEIFEKERFVVAPSFKHKELYTVSCYLSRYPQDSIKGASDPFSFEDSTPIKSFCQQAYDRMIENAKEICIKEKG